MLYTMIVCASAEKATGKCSDPPDRDLNRTWRAHNISEIRSKVGVKFIQNGSDWFANVTWQPPPDKRLYGYIVIQFISLEKKCKEVLNNKNYTILDVLVEENIPQTLWLAVFSLPGYLDVKDRNYTFDDFPPYKGLPGDLIPFVKPHDPPIDNWASYLAGVLGGILVIAFLAFILYRRKTCGSSGNSMKDHNPDDELIKINNTMKPQNNDIYFASYLPENEKFSDEVATIAYKLGTMGYKVVFDKVDSVHMNEIGFNMWVDKQILEAKKYIVFCSPGYVRLWQSLTSSGVDNKFNNVNDQDLVRVRYEIKRISDVYSENCSTSRIVCVKMNPKMTTKQLPPWMNHNMLLWPEQKEDVIRRLNDQAAMVMHV
ncbi:uncharacterized protein LOC110239631 isoform X3 [Exaiptasia diaphana]|uniref:SEFIR domain-containing protein n=1 Tax=Exaiptasia diaphana TaxID=2652724 RepID=A0A913YKM5_EXADI|nr:uncharacterized protein LOC110239631 isoform X3 [Exaiptasia diaphana]